MAYTPQTWHDDDPLYPLSAARMTHIEDGISAAATLDSPVFTGDPKAPTASPGDADTSIATTLFVDTAVTAAVGSPVSGTLTNAPVLWNGSAWVNARLPETGLAVQKTGTVAKTMQRAIAGNGAVACGATGVLRLWAIEVPAQTTFGFITFHSGTSGATSPTHQWACLTDASRVLLAISADKTSTAWASTDEQKFTIATIASGASATYTTTNTSPAMFYVGLLVTSSGQPTLGGQSTLLSINTVVPISGGDSTGSLTTPTAFPTTYSTITPTAGTPLVELTTA